MGIGLEVGADYGWNKTKETPVATVEGDTDVLLSQREEKRREMTPEEQKAADEAAIKSLAALDLEFRNPDLFND